MLFTTPIETEAATLIATSDGGMEIQFKPDVKLTVQNIQEILNARHQIRGNARYCVLVTQPEDIDFDTNVLTYDHYQHWNLHLCTYAVAWDTGAGLNSKLVELFFRYFPQPFPVRTFKTREEARAWLAEEQHE